MLIIYTFDILNSFMSITTDLKALNLYFDSFCNIMDDTEIRPFI